MLGYRTLFTVEPTQHGTLDLVREQLHAWMSGKSLDPDALRLDTWTKPAEHVDAIMLERTERDGSRARRVQLEEHNANGTWASQLTVLERGNDEPAVVWLDIVNPEVREDENGEGPRQRRQWTRHTGPRTAPAGRAARSRRHRPADHPPDGRAGR